MFAEFWCNAGNGKTWTYFKSWDECFSEGKHKFEMFKQIWIVVLQLLSQSRTHHQRKYSLDLSLCLSSWVYGFVFLLCSFSSFCRTVPASSAGIQLPTQSSKPSSAIQKAMEATLASIELPPPPTKPQEKVCVFWFLSLNDAIILEMVIDGGLKLTAKNCHLRFDQWMCSAWCVFSEAPKEEREEKKEIIQFKNKKEAIEAFKTLLKDKVCECYAVSPGHTEGTLVPNTFLPKTFSRWNLEKSRVIFLHVWFAESSVKRVLGTSHEVDHQWSTLRRFETSERKETGVPPVQDTKSQGGKGTSQLLVLTGMENTNLNAKFLSTMNNFLQALTFSVCFDSLHRFSFSGRAETTHQTGEGRPGRFSSQHWQNELHDQIQVTGDSRDFCHVAFSLRLFVHFLKIKASFWQESRTDFWKQWHLECSAWQGSKGDIWWRCGTISKKRKGTS